MERGGSSVLFVRLMDVRRGGIILIFFVQDKMGDVVQYKS